MFIEDLTTRTCKTLNTLVYSCEKTDQHKL
jgi:hypothetical protein